GIIPRRFPSFPSSLLGNASHEVLLRVRVDLVRSRASPLAFPSGAWERGGRGTEDEGPIAMRIRHRIPSIFNLSMVDVLCCALGCVILLWLLNLKDARQRALQASETDQTLVAVRSERDRLRDELNRLESVSAGLRADLDVSSRHLAETRDRLQAAE